MLTSEKEKESWDDWNLWLRICHWGWGRKQSECNVDFTVFELKMVSRRWRIWRRREDGKRVLKPASAPRHNNCFEIMNHLLLAFSFSAPTRPFIAIPSWVNAFCCAVLVARSARHILRHGRNITSIATRAFVYCGLFIVPTFILSVCLFVGAF